MNREYSVGLGCLIFLLAVLPTRAREQEPQAAHPVQEDLHDVGRSIQREERLLQRLRQQSGSLLQTLAEIDQELESACEELRRAERQMKEMEEALAGTRQRREETAEERLLLQRRLRIRVRSLHKTGEIGWMNLVFSAESVDEALERVHFLRWLARADGRLLAQTVRRRESLALAEEEIRRQQVRQAELVERVRERRREVEQVRNRHAEALKLVHREEALHRRAIGELRQARRRLVQVIAAIEGRQSAARGFPSWKGRLQPPVPGGRVEVAFGLQVDPRFKTKTRHQGVDIQAPEGTEVRAVYPGTVAFAENFRGYGLLLILDHGGGYYTLYAHLGRFLVSRGDKVAQGQALGTVGSTGSLKGPYLYFEVRQGGRAVDPQQWVRF